MIFRKPKTDDEKLKRLYRRFYKLNKKSMRDGWDGDQLVYAYVSLAVAMLCVSVKDHEAKETIKDIGKESVKAIWQIIENDRARRYTKKKFEAKVKEAQEQLDMMH